MVRSAPASRSFDNTADGHKQQSRMSIVAYSPGPVLSFVFRLSGASTKSMQLLVTWRCPIAAGVDVCDVAHREMDFAIKPLEPDANGGLG